MSNVAQNMPKSAALRRTPQQNRGKESRAKILDSAKNILSQGSFEKFSMRRISAASGVGLSTIYDYFPSKASVLHMLLEERLKLRLDVFDRTILTISHGAKLNEFIEIYLKSMRTEGFWSTYDIGLNDAASKEDSLQKLFDWHDAETINRYVSAFQSAGSKWPAEELRAAASYLISISAQFEPGVVSSVDKRSQKITIILLQNTFSMVLKKVLN